MTSPAHMPGGVVLWGGASDAFEAVVGRHLRQDGDLGLMRQTTNVGRLVTAPGAVVLAMGTLPVDQLKAAGVVGKGRTINSLRGEVYRHGEDRFMVTYNPDIVLSDPGKAQEVRWDARLAVRYAKTGGLAPVLGDYKLVKSFVPLIRRVKEKYARTRQPVDVAIDTETMGLNPYDPDKHLVSVQVTEEEGRAEIVHCLGMEGTPLEQLKREVNWLLNSPMVSVRGANFKYDLTWFWVKWRLRCTRFRFDTTIVGSLLDENRSNGLKGHVKEYAPILGGYDDELYDKHDIGHMEDVPVDVLVGYACGDADGTQRVANVLRPQLIQERRLARLYQTIIHRSARAFERVEARGVLVDQGRYAALRKELVEKKLELERECFKMMPARLKMRHADNLSLSRDALIRDFLFTPAGLGIRPRMMTPGSAKKEPEPSVAKEHLNQLADHPDAGKFIEAYQEWSKTAKTLGTFVDGFLKHLRADGRYHPTYMVYNGSMFDKEGDDAGTVSGRTSAKDPPMQVLPKHTIWAPKLRGCLVAPPGMLVWKCDYEQGELKITACWAHERTMLEAYRAGKDLHCMTASQINRTSYEAFVAKGRLGDDYKALVAAGQPITADAKLWKIAGDYYKKARQQAKAGNFGLLYGMGPEGFMAYARNNYGVKMTLAEAIDFWEAFFALYSGLSTWHDRQKNEARQTGCVVSPLGRVRHLPLIRSRFSEERGYAERQAINSPIQSTLSDLGQWAIADLEEEHGMVCDDPLDSELQIIGFDHDAIYGYCPEDRADYWLPIIVDKMANLPIRETFGWEHQLQFTADAETGLDMGLLEKFKLAA